MENLSFKIKTEVDLDRIILALEELKIPYSSRKLTNSAFPALDTDVAEITVSTAYQNTLNLLIQTPSMITAQEPLKHEEEDSSLPIPNTRKISMSKVLLILYALVTTVLVVRHWYIDYKNNNAKHSSFEWNYEGTELSTIHKTSKKTMSMITDRNHDLNFEKTSMYSKNGEKIEDCFDFDEDGYFESVYCYNTKNDLVFRQQDQNNDGIYDKYELMLSPKDTLVLIHKNLNSYLEILK